MRYSRQALLPEIGTEGQEKLRQARVLLVGAGGLGSPAALYLAGAGTGHLTVVDNDTVSLTNLHRQVLYGEAEVGSPKAPCAANRLRSLNSEIEVEAIAARFDEQNAERLVQAHDIVVDGSDNFTTRYLIDSLCARHRRPYVYGAICGFEAQAAVFHASTHPNAPSYARLYPTPPEAPGPKAVIGPTAALCASVQAAQVLALICGYQASLVDKLWFMNLKTMEGGVISL